MKAAELRDLEIKLKNTGCINNGAELFRAILSLGIACAFDSPTKIKLNNVRADLKDEEVILRALLKRMGYFDGVVAIANSLAHHAAGLINTTKKFRSKLAATKKELELDFKEVDIIENMGDVDFANDFAETLWDRLNELKKACDVVSKDCLGRKHALEKVLIHLKGEEEE